MQVADGYVTIGANTPATWTRFCSAFDLADFEKRPKLGRRGLPREGPGGADWEVGDHCTLAWAKMPRGTFSVWNASSAVAAPSWRREGARGPDRETGDLCAGR